MSDIKMGFSEMIGHTPVVRFAKLERALGAKGMLLAKAEGMNPAGSAKDRAALSMIEDAEARGLLLPGATIVEPTSGNTGIGLAAVAACRGYRVILTMPDTMSKERRDLLAAYGAELVLTEGARGMAGALEKAREILARTPGAFMPGQFDNPANARAHYAGTGPEIWAQTGGEIAAFVAGVGTGGTVTGVGAYLKEQNPAVRVIGVEPASSPVLAGGKPGPHKIQGIGANFVPSLLRRELLDEIIPVTNEDAYRVTRLIAREEGLLCGISGGAAMYAASQVAARAEFAGKMVLALLPDNGDKYLSTGVFT